MRWATVGSGTQERARDLLGRQTSEQAERERNARLGREHRMTGDEDEAQQVVADVVVEGRVEIRHGHLFRLELATEFLVLALEHACCGASDRWRDAWRWP